MAKELTHIALHVRNRAQSEAFYKKYGGMVNASPDVNQFSPWLSSPGQEGRFALVLVPTAKTDHRQPNTDVTRLGFSVESPEKLKQLYIQAVADDIVRQAYDQNPTSGRCNFRVTDPDGFFVELWYAENPPLSEKFNNLSLHTINMNMTREFYSRWADMDVLLYGKVSKSCRIVTPGQPDPFQIVLCDDAVKPAYMHESDISHIGVAVESMSELEELHARAQSEGIVFRPLQSPSAAAGTLFIVKDPDGRNLEFSYGQFLGDRFAKLKMS